VAALAAALGAPSFSASAAPTAGTPTYANHEAPGTLAKRAGEPSIGVNWKSGAVFFQASDETLKIDFDSRGRPTWTDVSSLQTSFGGLDPILATDNVQGRVFVSQLTGFDSLSAFSEDDGKTWTSSQGGGIPSGVDHQSIGAGPYPAGSIVGPLTAYPNAVYYCSQSVVTAFCARSDNGGLTYGPGVPIYAIDECGGLHGHVRVGPDGTVYVPNKSCNGTQAVAVSRDAGLTWTLRPVLGSLPNPYILDPSMGIASDNTGYFGYVGRDGLAKVAVTRDRGETFTEPFDVGAQVGVFNATFPEVIAGDGDRAAFAFLGTKTKGDAQNPSFGRDGSVYSGAEWHLYVSSTFDRGATWKTVDLTPNDPVQRGRVCNTGTTCTSRDRNLLDFMDIQVDKEGRVLVGWADGCRDFCVDGVEFTDNGLTAKGNISRQVSGKRLFAQYDAKATVTPVAAPSNPTAAPTSTGARLAATGASVLLALLGVGALVGAILLRRRMRQPHDSEGGEN